MPREAPRTQDLLLRVLAPCTILLSMALAATVYVHLRHSILEGFDRKLLTTSGLAGALIDPADHIPLSGAALQPGLDAAVLEAGEAYQRNVRPMQAIRQALDLTYLYTEVLGGPEDIVYVLDATEGEEHSPPGFADSLPPDTLARVREVYRGGAVYVSPIQLHERWGLLKVSAAPIRAPDGAVVGVAGADVNISVIRLQTANALFQSAVVGTLALIAAAVAIWLIARRLAGPLEDIRLEALQLAAGERVRGEHGRLPRELLRLRRPLQQLGRAVTGLRKAADIAAADRRRAAEAMAVRGLLEPPAEAKERLAAFPPPGLEPLDAALWRRAMAEAARRLKGDPVALQRFVSARPGLLVLRAGKEVRAFGHGAAEISMAGEAPVPLAGGGVLRAPAEVAVEVRAGLAVVALSGGAS